MTATDVALAKVMRDELALRWPHRVWDAVTRKLSGEVTRQPAPTDRSSEGKLGGLLKALGFVDETSGHHIVLISECGSHFYGQSLPDDVASCLGPLTDGKAIKFQ